MTTPTIIDHPARNQSRRIFDTLVRPGTAVDVLLLHHTGTDAKGRWSDQSALNTLTAGFSSGVSSHYVVTTAGAIYRLVPEHLKAWHAGKGRLPWETCPEYDFNHRSIGIEVVNPGDNVTPFSEAQYRALKWLVPDIVRRLGWEIVHLGVKDDNDAKKSAHVIFQPGVTTGRVGHVLGHRDVAPGRKTDPADNFDWSRIREALAGGVA